MHPGPIASNTRALLSYMHVHTHMHRFYCRIIVECVRVCVRVCVCVCVGGGGTLQDYRVYIHHSSTYTEQEKPSHTSLCMQAHDATAG